MEGVQILNQYEIATREVFNTRVFWITLAVVAVTVIVASLINFRHERFIAVLLTSLMIGVAFGAMFGLIGAQVVVPKLEGYVIRYEVIIDDTVPMKEFTDKYDIIEQRGEIYIVEEKQQ